MCLRLGFKHSFCTVSHRIPVPHPEDIYQVAGLERKTTPTSADMLTVKNTMTKWVVCTKRLDVRNTGLGTFSYKALLFTEHVIQELCENKMQSKIRKIWI